MSTIRELIKKWRDDVCDCTSDVHPINHRAVMARLGAIEKAAEALEADRDNWMKQALAEDERANAACDAASARNCDKFNDPEKAWRAYKQTNPNGMWFDTMSLWDCIKWLFAETKGESDGSK